MLSCSEATVRFMDVDRDYEAPPTVHSCFVVSSAFLCLYFAQSIKTHSLDGALKRRHFIIISSAVAHCVLGSVCLCVALASSLILSNFVRMYVCRDLKVILLDRLR